MQSTRFVRQALVCAAVLLAGAGCQFYPGGPQASFERTVELRHPCAPGTTLAVSTASGSIEATGEMTDQVHVVATIRARAWTEAEAQELAEQVEIRFDQTAETLAIKADRPSRLRNQSISISYEIVQPQQSHLECDSASGSLEIANLDGNVLAYTASGSVRAKRIQGSARLHSSSGQVRAEQITGGEVRLDSTSGNVRLSEASDIDACELRAASGSLTAEDVVAASIRISASSGNIKLGNATAASMDLHTSSGKLTADNINCEELTAEASSGSISITFSFATPADLVAHISAGSGNVTADIAPSYAGRVDLSARSGAIHSDLPVLAQGRLGKHHISGSLGDGSGNLLIRTGSGSVHVR